MKFFIYYINSYGEKRYLSSFSANTETHVTMYSDNIRDAAQFEHEYACRIKAFRDMFGEPIHHISHE